MLYNKYIKCNRSTPDYSFLRNSLESYSKFCRYSDFTGAITIEDFGPYNLNLAFNIKKDEFIARIEFGMYKEARRTLDIIIYTISLEEKKAKIPFEQCRVKQYRREKEIGHFFEIFDRVDFVIIPRG